jgi:hypothetical protein
MTPRVRTAVTHAGTAFGGALAAAMFLSTRGVDLYAIFNQFNVVVADVVKLIGLVAPLVTTAYGVYKAGTRQKFDDILADPLSPAIAREMAVTPQAVAVGNALKE